MFGEPLGERGCSGPTEGVGHIADQSLRCLRQEALSLCGFETLQAALIEKLSKFGAKQRNVEGASTNQDASA
jgi:hypothetical protein